MARPEDYWPTRRLMFIEIIAAHPVLSTQAKVIAIGWVARLHRGRALEMSVAETARRSGRQERANTSRAISELEQVLGACGWLRIDRRRSHANGCLPQLIFWPVLEQAHLIAELHVKSQQSNVPPMSGLTQGGVSDPPAPDVQLDTGLVSVPTHQLPGPGAREYRSPRFDLEARGENDPSLAGALWRRRARRSAGG